MKDAGERSDLEAGMAKLFASETGKEVVEESFRIHGGYGYSKEYEIERLYRDAPLLLIGEGTSEIQKMVIGKKVLEQEQDLERRALVSGANRGHRRRDRRAAGARPRLHCVRRLRATPSGSRAARTCSRVELDVDRRRLGRRRDRRRSRPNPGAPRRAGQQRRRLRRPDRRRPTTTSTAPTSVFETNVFGPWRLAQAALPLLRAQRRAADRQRLQRRRPARRHGQRPRRLPPLEGGAERAHPHARRRGAADQGQRRSAPAGCGPTWAARRRRARSPRAPTPAFGSRPCPATGPSGGFFRDREPIPW